MEDNPSTNKLKIYLLGKNGQMGRALQNLIALDPSILLVEEDPDVVIDFSSDSGTKRAIEMKKPLVCGTTALLDETKKALCALAQKVPVVHAPNFSLGICQIAHMIQSLPKKFIASQNAHIKEIHHTKKKDTPSGTALFLSKLLAQNVPITSERIEGAVGTHTITLSLLGETITITHEAFSREAFAKGALLCTKYIFNKPPRFYTVKEVFFD